MVSPSVRGFPIRCSPSTMWRSVAPSGFRAARRGRAACASRSRPGGRRRPATVAASTRTRMVRSRGMPFTKLAVIRNATTIQKPSMIRSTAGGCKRQRKPQVVPVRQQVAADHLARPQRQHFVGEQSDVDGLHGPPETDPRHRLQQGSPAPAMSDVNPEIGGHCQADPPVIQRPQRGPEFVERISVQHPDQAPGRDAVPQHLRKP